MEEQVTEVEQDVILQNNELLLHFSIHHKGLLALKMKIKRWIKSDKTLWPLVISKIITSTLRSDITF